MDGIRRTENLSGHFKVLNQKSRVSSPEPCLNLIHYQSVSTCHNNHRFAQNTVMYRISGLQFRQNCPALGFLIFNFLHHAFKIRVKLFPDTFQKLSPVRSGSVQPLSTVRHRTPGCRPLQQSRAPDCRPRPTVPSQTTKRQT